MSENVARGASSGDPLKSVADVLRRRYKLREMALRTRRQPWRKALSAASRFLSRLVYTTCYTMSYGVVFPTVLIAKSIPTNNAFVNGFLDGCELRATWSNS